MYMPAWPRKVTLTMGLSRIRIEGAVGRWRDRARQAAWLGEFYYRDGVLNRRTRQAVH
jgi:hypothetical protein